MKLLERIKGSETENREEEALHTNTRPVIFIGIFVLIVGFLGFIAWASFAPMTNGINVPGVVSVASEEDIMQSRYGGTIKKILVREGAAVKKNQTLILLEDARRKASLASVKSGYITYLAMYARLKAEDEGRLSVKFPRALLSFKNSIHAREAMATQKKLFHAEMANLKNEENILNINITGFKNYIENMEELKKSTARQITLAKKEMAPLKKLAKKGYYPKVKIIEMEGNVYELTGRLNEESGSIARGKASVSRYESELDNLKNSFLKNVNTRLSDVQSRVFALRQQYISALSRFKHSRVKSPADGIVVKIYVKTIGGAIMPGQPMINILPLHQNLIVKAAVPIQDIARLRKGLTADLRFPAFQVEDIPVISGRVIYVSANSVENAANHMPYYTCKIRLGAKGLKTLAERKLRLKPGMPAEVTVKTGAKTLMSDILNPLLYKISNAFVR